MTDDTLRKEKYLCTYDGHDGITIGDLFIKATNPVYNRKVSLKKGEYVLTELLDFEDLKKSRIAGALSKFIEMGWVTVENPSIPVAQRVAKSLELAAPDRSQSISEREMGSVLARDITNLVGAVATQPKDLGYPADTQPKVIESLSLDKSRNTNSLAISEPQAASPALTAQETFDKFESLRYFQKLKAIKESVSIVLLEMIVARSSYPQLVHNAKNRIRELQNGR